MRLRPLVFLVTPLFVGLMSAGTRAEDVTAQCIASSEQGLDLRKQEKLLDARKVLATCATTKCPDEIRTVCEQRIAEINAALPAIAFEVKDAAGNDEPNVKVSIDGAPATAQLGGRAIAIDPGPHAFSFEVPGQPPVEKKLTVSEGDRDRRERIVIGGPAQPAMAPGAATVEASPAASSGGTQKMLGIVAGGVGVVGVALGTVFGVVASSKWSSAKSDCGNGCASDAPAQQEKSSAQGAATVSTVGFIGGGLLVAAGLALYMTAPSEAKNVTGATSAATTAALRITPALGPGEAALLVRGGF